MGIHARSSPRDDVGELRRQHNRLVDRDSGATGGGQRVRWTDYDGNLKDPYGAAPLATSDFTQVLRNTAVGGQHLAVLLSSTAASAVPSASNSVLIVQDGAVAIGAGKSLTFFNASGTNGVALGHSGTNNVLRTAGGHQVTGALNVGGSILATSAGDTSIQSALNVGSAWLATAAGDASIQRALNVGPAIVATAASEASIQGALNVGPTRVATAAGDGYLSGNLQTAVALNVGATASATTAGVGFMSTGLSVGTFALPAAGELRASAGVFSFAQPVSRVPLETALGSNYALTNAMANVGVSVTLSGLGQWLIISKALITHSGAGDLASEVYTQITVAAGGTLTVSDVTISTMNPTGVRQTAVGIWFVNVTSGTPIVQLQAQRNAGTGASLIGATHTKLQAWYLGKPS